MKKKENSWKLFFQLVALLAVIILVVGIVIKVIGGINDKIDGFGGGNKSTSTTKKTQTTATTISPSQCDNHTFEKGVCVKCGTVCAHERTEVSDNGNTYCSVCGLLRGLKAPVITVSENVISWEAVPEATGYVVAINAETYGTVNTSYTFTIDKAGTYEITVKAVSNGITSEASNVYTATYYSLSVDLNDRGELGNGDGYYNPARFFIREGDTFSGRIYPHSGYALPEEIYVTMGGVKLNASQYMYINTTGEFSIPNVTGNLYITFDAPLAIPEVVTGLSFDGRTLTWNPAKGATEYAIRITNNDHFPSYDQYFTVKDETSFMALVYMPYAGNYHIAVWARNDYGDGEAASVDYELKAYIWSEDPNDHGSIQAVEDRVLESSILHGISFTARIVPDHGYVLPEEIYITMGGAPLDSSQYTYNSGTGVFYIGRVTGDLHITYDAPLAIPETITGLKISGTVVSWNAAARATEYGIRVTHQDYLFDEYYSVKSGTTFDLSTCGFTDAGTYHVAVWAKNDHGDGESVAVDYTYTPAPKYILDGVYMFKSVPVIPMESFIDWIKVDFSVVGGDSYKGISINGDFGGLLYHQSASEYWPAVTAYYSPLITDPMNPDHWEKQNYRVVRFNNAEVSKNDYDALMDIMEKVCNVPEVSRTGLTFKIAYPETLAIYVYANGQQLNISQYDVTYSDNQYIITVHDDVLKFGKNSFQFKAYDLTGALEESDFSNELTYTYIPEVVE